MASSDKKVRKNQKKREGAKREAARQKRRQLRSQMDHSNDADQFIDSAHSDLFANVFGDSSNYDLPSYDSPSDVEADAGNPVITAWWNRYSEGDGSQRLSMVRKKLSEEIDEEWREAIFPEAVFECETCCNASDYVALLETLASDHRSLYDLGLLWFLSSRVSHYLSAGNTEQIDDAVSQDAAALKEADQAYYGIVSMLRLAGLARPADTLAIAGFRIMDASELTPWAVDELFHFFMDSHVRQCVAAGGDADAIKRLESVLEENDASMDENVVLLRAEMIRRLTGKTKTKWVPNQLLGTKNRARENRYLLSFEFAHWLSSQRGIPPIAADELRELVRETLSRDGITMRSYFDGLSQPSLDQHLAGMLGFMSLDRFKAPATLIAVEHFVSFLSEIGLVKPESQTRSRKVIANLSSQLQRAFGDEWTSFSFLDPLRNSDR